MASSPSVFAQHSSPTFVSQHRYPDQYFHDSHYRPANGQRTSGFNFGQSSPATSRFSQPPTPSEDALAGRKRSRGDALSHEDDVMDGAIVAQQAQTTFNCQPQYGPGMTIGHPHDLVGHYNQVPEPSRMDTPNRPKLSTRKSMRLTAGPSAPSTPLDMPELPQMPQPDSEMFIDEASRALGISWTRLDVNENNMIKQRAFTRWIVRHYPFLRNVELYFENSAIMGYLGKAHNDISGFDEYYLWSHDLHQAVLVTRQASDLVFKLSQPHMSLAQATETIKADLEPVVEAAAANAAILRNDRYLYDSDPPVPEGGMDLD